MGADASDHGIIRPATQVMTVSISNNPLSTGFVSNTAGFVSNFIDSAGGALVAGLSAGFLGNDGENRAKSVLEFFVAIMYSRTPFDVDSVDNQLSNMVITKLRRTRNIENEGGIDLIVEMRELSLLSTTISVNQPSVSILNDNDPSQSQLAAERNKGEVLGVSVSSATQSVIEGLL